MEMKKSEAQLLGQLLGLLIILGILLIKIIIIYLDKKWHEKGHGRWIQGIRDLPPLYAGQSTQHPMLNRWNQGMLRSLQSPVSLIIDQMRGFNSPPGSQNSNWIVTKRRDSTQSQELR